MVSENVFSVLKNELFLDALYFLPYIVINIYSWWIELDSKAKSPTTLKSNNLLKFLQKNFVGVPLIIFTEWVPSELTNNKL